MHGQRGVARLVTGAMVVTVIDAMVGPITHRMLDHGHTDLFAVVVVAVVHPGGGGQQGQHEGDAHRGDAQFRSTAGKFLAEEQDPDERQCRQQRN